MHQNTCLTIPDVKNDLFKAMNLVARKYAQIHQNTFLTTLDVMVWYVMVECL